MLRIEKILCPTDFFPCADQALDHAVYLAGRYGAELHVLHAVILHEDDPYNPAAHVVGLEEIQLQIEELAGKIVSGDYRERREALLPSAMPRIPRPAK